jgi:hypothetical protein
VLTICGSRVYEMSHWQAVCHTGNADSSWKFTATFPAGFLDATGSASVFHHLGPRVDSYVWVIPPLASADWSDNDVFGYAQGGGPITATLESGAPGNPTLEIANGVASGVYGYYEVGFQMPFQAGYRIKVDGAMKAIMNLRRLSVTFGADDDRISGRADPGARLQLQCYGRGKGNSYYGQATANAAGRYV